MKAQVTKKKKSQRTYESTVEVCCHTVAYQYFLDSYRLTDDIKIMLDEYVEERAQDNISSGCSQGKLNFFYQFKNGKEAEIRGWWKIKPKFVDSERLIVLN